MSRAPQLRLAVAAIRCWARSKGLCGGDGVPSSHTWLVLTAHVLQYREGLPHVELSADTFDALLQSGRCAI